MMKGEVMIHGCFRKSWYPQIIHFNRVFHYKPSILGYPYFGNTHIVTCKQGLMSLDVIHLNDAYVSLDKFETNLQQASPLWQLMAGYNPFSPIRMHPSSQGPMPEPNHWRQRTATVLACACGFCFSSSISPTKKTPMSLETR